MKKDEMGRRKFNPRFMQKTRIKKPLGRLKRESQVNKDLKGSERGCELDSTTLEEDTVTA